MFKSSMSLALVLIISCIERPGLAHQPIITESKEILVSEPEISKGYYGKLSGAPHVYTIKSEVPFELYVGILVPATKTPKEDVSAQIRQGSKTLATIGGPAAQWKAFFEPFGQSAYRDGGEYKVHAGAGVYSVVVSSSNNDSRYVLGVGETELFGPNEIWRAIRVIPDLKRNFFDESPMSFIKSPFGWGYIAALYLLAFAFGFAYRLLMRRLATSETRKVSRNIGRADRIIRLGLAVGLLLWAITTSWNPLLIFFSGFALFESIFSWCGLYAGLGKNSCPT